MEASGIDVAPWVKEMLGKGVESFYRTDDGRLSFYDSASKSYVSEQADEREQVKEP
jgi:3-hydroxyacyl-CoA dehydrogenase